jgi:hypothetical protein
MTLQQLNGFCLDDLISEQDDRVVFLDEMPLKEKKEPKKVSKIEVRRIKEA